jgi:AcrR family transcriptional regulator
MVAATGFTRGAFYFHFDSKDTLAEAIVNWQAELWPQVFEAVSRDEPDPLRRMVKLVFSSAALFETDIVVRAGSRLIKEQPLISRELADTYPWWIDTVHHLLGEAAELGQLTDTSALGAADDPPGLAALAGYLVHSWGGTALTATGGGLEHLRGQVYATWRMALAAIARAPHPLDDLLRLTDELAAQWEADPRSLLAGLGDTADEPGAGEIETPDDGHRRAPA